MGVLWEEAVFALFDDLEMQAAGLYAVERHDEVEALAEAGFAEVSLASRMHASRGNEVRLAVGDDLEIRGRLAGAGAGWSLLDSGAQEWLVPWRALVLAEGLSTSSLPERLWPVGARLSIRSALRRISAVGGTSVSRLRGGRQVEGRLRRVGADFVEIAAAGSLLQVPIGAILAVQGNR